MPAALDHVQDGDWDRVRLNTGRTAQALNPPVPQARVFNSANLSVANNTVTTLTFNSERFDSGNLHSTSSNTGRLTAPITGLYMVGCTISWGVPSAAGERLIRITHSNGTVLTRDQRFPASTSYAVEHSLTTVWQMVAGEYVYVEAFQDSGGAVSVQSSPASSPEFWMFRVAGYVNQGV